MSVEISSGPEYEHFMQVVERMGYKRADFVIRESAQGEVTRSVMVRSKRVAVTITRMSRQIQREYRGGARANWSTNAEWELMQGVFGTP